MKIPSQARYDYSPITERPQYSWPDGKRLALYFALNIEHFAFGAGKGHVLSTELPWPNARTFAWRDYGNRVGVWRFLDLFEEFKLPACHLINTTVFDHSPQIVKALVDRKDEFIGHGRTNSEQQGQLWEEDEARLIESVRDRIFQASGSYPRGWMGPWMSQSAVTADLLQEAGFCYAMDWPCDDQPIWLRTRSGKKLMSMPYSYEINDSPQVLARNHSAEEFGTMLYRQFDEMLSQSEKQPLVLGIALHTMIMGQPHRINVLREVIRKMLSHPKFSSHVWITRPTEIYDHCLSLGPDAIP
jgi:allantoinase